MGYSKLRVIVCDFLLSFRYVFTPLQLQTHYQLTALIALILYRIVTDSRSTKSDAPTWEALLVCNIVILRHAYADVKLIAGCIYNHRECIVLLVSRIRPDQSSTSNISYSALNIAVLSLYLRSSTFVFIIIGINPACIVSDILASRFYL
jgi:hypothetical protein